ncbi:MAG: homocysteine S-methyltransferase family protein [Gammaproteobacteria bacterium]|nr:homocysteine S-methyltransferase family protein [Gammaproteobacteria bacterium]
MAKYRNNLPQLSGDLYLTDGGIETTMIFHEKLDLPEFAAFTLLNNPRGIDALNRYFHAHCQIASTHQVGFILETITWRASHDWSIKLGYSKQELDKLLHKAVEFLLPFRDLYENDHTKMVISGCVGPRGDGYVPSEIMSVDEAQDYHAMQINTLSNTDADMVTALTFNYVEEAIGVVRAARACDMPIVLAFTVETDGRLPTGQTLKDAIEQVESESDQAPVYYKINCAHPTHFEDVVSTGESWLERIHSIRANASSCSHAELDEAEELDEGDPLELAQQYLALVEKLPNLNVLGGCCGTDSKHIETICRACINR